VLVTVQFLEVCEVDELPRQGARLRGGQVEREPSPAAAQRCSSIRITGRLP
jgi:hypothetical protein